MRDDGAMRGAVERKDPPKRRTPADFNADGRLLILVLMAAVVGTAGAFSALALVKLIALCSNIAWFGRFDFTTTPISHTMTRPWMALIPAAGGLIIGLMARFGSEKIRGHGIPEAIEAILIGGSRMSPKVAVLKPLSSAISIGTGGPFGAEGPIIMTGGALGSLFAQFFQLSAAERKTLLVAGAASGMTAIFGTPMAAVLMAVELLLFEWRPRSFIPVAISAIVSICWRPMLFGSGPLFAAHLSDSLPWWGLGACAGMGVVIGLQSAFLTKALYIIEDAFEHLPIHWMWWPAIGGLIVGLGGLVEPRALGVGYDVIRDLLTSHMVIKAVVLILLVKAGIWLVALSSGTSGGVLAPLLILGGALGWLIGLYLPGEPGLWALLGMAAMLGGTMRAPLTGAVFALELTGDFELLAPLLTAAVAAYGVTVLLMKRSILTEKIARRGQHIAREYAVDPFELARIGDVMVSDVETLPADASVAEAVSVLQFGRHQTYPVVDKRGRVIGMVTRAEALNWAYDGADGGERVCDRVSDAAMSVVHPDDLAMRAIDVMVATGQGRLAVTDPKTGVLKGLVTRKDLLKVRASVAKIEGERSAYFGPSGKPA